MYCDTIEKHIKQIFDNAKVLDLEGNFIEFR